MIGRVLINGEASDGSVPVTDSSVLRGDGCFEALRSYGGVVFALKEHLDRLDRSASALGIGLPSRSDLERWITSTAAEFGRLRSPDCGHQRSGGARRRPSITGDCFRTSMDDA